MNPAPRTNSLHRGGLNQRIFAWMSAHSRERYDTFTGERKQKLFGSLHGVILEIGPGVGPNLQYYPEDINWVGVEPNRFMYPYLEKTIRRLDRPGERYRIEPGIQREFDYPLITIASMRWSVHWCCARSPSPRRACRKY